MIGKDYESTFREIGDIFYFVQNVSLIDVYIC